MPFMDKEFLKRLENVPNPNSVVNELFKKAKSASEQRFYCSIIDVKRTLHEEKSYLQCELSHHSVVQQFAEYFSNVLIPIDDYSEINHKNFIRRLHMLAYSQFWECLGIQRLISSLVNISSGKDYDPHLFLDEYSTTYDKYKDIRKNASKQNLSISQFLTAVYSNQIRNAFVHSDFWIIGDYVSFQNHDHSKSYSIPSIKIDTWDKLFEITSDFIIAFFKARRNAEAELSQMEPYQISLCEFKGPFSLSKDSRGYWSAKS